MMLLALSGCGSAPADGQTVREHFETLAGFEAELKILSDLGQSVLEYQVDYVYNREDNDTFTITAPESLAGIGGTIAGTDNASFTLQYDGLALDDAMPQRTGLTPADALFCLMNGRAGAAVDGTCGRCVAAGAAVRTAGCGWQSRKAGLAHGG